MLQQLTVLIGFVVRSIDECKKLLQIRGRALDRAVAPLQLPGEEFVHSLSASVRVVIVMVWLCSSQRADGANGEISPYE